MSAPAPRLAIATTEAPAPAGSYSQAMQAGAGLVFLSGQTPRHLDGRRAGDAPFAEQARLALDNLQAVARACGLSLADAVKVNVYLRHAEHRLAFDQIYSEYVRAPFPARTLSLSPFIDFDVEVDAILQRAPGTGPAGACAAVGPESVFHHV